MSASNGTEGRPMLQPLSSTFGMSQVDITADTREPFPPGVAMHSGDGLAVVTLSGRVVHWNDTAVETLRVPRSAAVGSLIADISRAPEVREVIWGHHITTVGAHLSGNPPVRRVLRARDYQNRLIDVKVSSIMLELEGQLPLMLYTHTVEAVPDGDDIELQPPLGLTQREWEVACLLMSGLGTSEVAYELKIAYATVRAHIRNLLSTLDANSRTQALMRLWSRYGTPELAEFPGFQIAGRTMDQARRDRQ